MIRTVMSGDGTIQAVETVEVRRELIDAMAAVVKAARRLRTKRGALARALVHVDAVSVGARRRSGGTRTP